MKRHGWSAGLLLWVIVVGGGFGWTIAHGSTPQPTAVAPARWPDDTRLVRDPSRPTLVLFAHPRCPCTRASLHELAWVLTRAHDALRTVIVFAKPRGAPPGFEDTALHRTAEALPGDVTVLDDEGDTETHRFLATTSGHVVLYDASGALQFSGGITAGRGHEGQNDARDALLARLSLLSSHSPSASPGNPTSLLSRVYGCALDTPTVLP